MESSRDSSVWRSLAVAFGDGLAFGVGMKLTQQASRASVAAPQTDLTPVADRLEQMERRIAEIEQTRRKLITAERAALPAQPFDQKVLEAVVTALDARLHEHSGQVERQITDLQAKIIIELQTLHQQDRSIADGLQARIEELQEQFTSQLAAARGMAEGNGQALQEQLSALRQETAGLIASGPQARIEELREQFTGQLAALRNSAEGDRQAMREQAAALQHDVADILAGQYEALEQHIREEVHQSAGKVAAMAASAAEATIEERMAPLRAAVESKDREIAELRSRLAGSDQATLDLLQGVGQICRQAAQRFAVPQAPPPEAPSGSVELQTAASVENLPQGKAAEPGPVPVEEMDSLSRTEAIPGFAQPKPPGRLLRIPLVSSLVLTTGVMLILHYLRLG